MTTTWEDIFYMISEQVDDDPAYQKQWKAAKDAVEAAVAELEFRCGKECQGLLDAIGSLTAKRHELREMALFRSALRLGLELGRLSAN